MAAAGSLSGGHRLVAAVALLLTVFLSTAHIAAGQQNGRSLLAASATATCQLNPSSGKCGTNPLLVTSLPAPKSRIERLVAHYSALSYACSQHKAEPDCIADAANSCAYRQDKRSSAPLCVVSPLAVVEHGAEALLCKGSKALQYFRCQLASKCADATGCTEIKQGACVPEFQKTLQGKELSDWEKALMEGKAEAWGKCMGAAVFRHLFANCRKHSERKCVEHSKCEWAARGGGAGGLCAPTLWSLEAPLTVHREHDFSKSYFAALKACHTAKAPECTSTATFVPKLEVLQSFATIASVTAAPETPLVRLNGTATRSNATKHKHLTPTGAPKKHHNKHRPHTPPTAQTPTTSSKATPPLTAAKPPLAAAAPPRQAPAGDSDSPSAAGVVLLVLASLVAVAAVCGTAYLVYNHIRNPKSSHYHPVESTETTEMASNTAATTAGTKPVASEP